MKRVAVILLIACSSAQAIIFYSTGDPTYNSTAPTGDLANSGWQYEGLWGEVLGTPIAPNFFISASHVGNAGNSVFSYQSTNYSVLRPFQDPATDLIIWRVSQTFPTFAPLYTNQDEVGQLVVDIGRGTDRGDEIDLNGTLQGWGWGAANHIQRWGENIVSSIYSNGPNDDLLRATFDQNGITNECTLSSGDSGGAAFISDNGVWKLAGINYGVDGPFYTDSSGDPNGGFDAALIEMGGFWQDNSTPPPSYVQISGPSAFYPTRISTRVPWICSIIAGPQLGQEGNFLTLTYTQLTGVTGLTYTVEQSSDLASWATANVQNEVVSTNGNFQTIKAKVDITGLNVLFLHLLVTD